MAQGKEREISCKITYMAHIHDKIDFVISAFIVHDNNILFVDHKRLRRWLPVGGHIELDEDPERALFREIKEEAGIDVSHLRVLSSKPNLHHKGINYLYTPNYLDIHDITEGHKHIGLIYFLTSDTNVISLKPDEHENIKWFTIGEIESGKYHIGDDVKFYTNEALKRAKDQI